MEASVGAGSRVVDALRAVCSMQDENTEQLRRRTLGDDGPKEPPQEIYDGGQKPWPVTPTASEKEAELQRAQKTNIWDWRLKGQFREKPKTKETRKAMFMYQKHRETVSNLGIFKIDQDITAYEEILQQGIEKRNKRRAQDGKGVPPLPIRPSSAAVSGHSRSQDFASSSLVSMNQRSTSTTVKSSLPARPASAAAHPSVNLRLSSPSPQAAARQPAARQSSPGSHARPASAAFASNSPTRSTAGERAKSAMPWMRSSTSTSDGIKGADTFLTACREDSRELEPAVSLDRQSSEGEVGGNRGARELDRSLVSVASSDRNYLAGQAFSSTASGPQGWFEDELRSRGEGVGLGGELEKQLKGAHEYRLELAEIMKPPEERRLDAKPATIADYLPTPKNITPKTEFQHGKEYLQNLKNDLETKVAALEHIYDHEQASPRTLEAIIARKNKLNAGWTKESLAHLDNGQKATAEATKSLADIDAKMADFRDVLTVMTEEWLRVDDLMDHVDLLMKSFDTMTDGHLLLSGNALPARIDLASEDPATSPKRYRPKHLLDDGTDDGTDGGSTNRSRRSSGSRGSAPPVPPGLGSLADPPPPRPQAGGGPLAISTTNLTPPPHASLSRTPTQNLMRQGTMSRQQSSKNMTPNLGGKHGRQTMASANLEKQKAMAVQEWLDAAGVDAAKVYNAALVDRAFMGHPDAAKSGKDVWRRVESGPEADAEARRERESATVEGDEVAKGEEYVKQSELRWHHGMGAVRSVIKSGHVIVRTATAGTQIPELNEIEWTISHQLRGKPKFIKDFAVRGLTFPTEWEAFLSGMPNDQPPKLLTTTELSQTILDIYFAKLLHENKERTTQEFKMSMAEYVCFHLLEDSGDMDDAKVLLRDLAYSVAEQHELSNKFRLFARFCGVLQAVPDVILDFYLLFMLECKPYIVKPVKRGSPLDKLVSRGRDFIMSDSVATVVEKAFSQSMSAREFAIQSKMSKIPILRQVEDSGVKMDLCDVDDIWLNVSEEFEQQYEQGRIEAGKLLLAADVNQDGNVDLEEFVEIIRLFDASFSKAQVAKMYFDAIAESGSDNITHKAFLVVGDKYKLFQTRGLKMLDLSQRDVSALNAQSLHMLRKALENEDEKIVQRINIFTTTAGNEQEAKGKQVLHEYETLKEGVEEAYALMDKVGEDSSLVPDPNPLWAQYHHVNKQLAGVILNFGVRRVINTLTVLGKQGKSN